MNIGEINGVQVAVFPEIYEEIRKQKIIEENKILKEQQEEIERLNTILNNIHNYIEKMSYCDIVDNPKKELSRILERVDKSDR